MIVVRSSYLATMLETDIFGWLELRLREYNAGCVQIATSTLNRKPAMSATSCQEFLLVLNALTRCTHHEFRETK